MRMIAQVAFLVAGVHVLAVATASAGPITLSATFNQGTTDFTVGGVNGATVCSFSTSTRPMNESCSGSRTFSAGTQTATGSFTGTAQVDASTSGTLALSSSTSLDAQRQNSSSYFATGDYYFANVSTTAEITDTVTILGAGTLTGGFLRLTFDLDGTITELWDEFTPNGFSPTMTCPGTTGDCFFASEGGAVIVNSTSGGFSFGGAEFIGGVADVTRQVTLDVPILFSNPQSLLFRFSMFSGANLLASDGFRINSDFYNTLVLSDALVLDANKQVIPTAQLVSGSGYSYPGATGSVPEPATLSLLGVSLVGSLVRRFRARGRRRPVCAQAPAGQAS